MLALPAMGHAAQNSAENPGAAAAVSSAQGGTAARGVTILKAEPAATATPARPDTPAPQRCSPPLAPSDVQTSQFQGNFAKFDRELARKLKQAKQVVSVDVAEPWQAPDAPPPIVGRWLEEIKASGGKVIHEEYCVKSRGLFSFLNRLLARKPVDHLAEVRNYDAVLQVNGGDQSVTQILFRKRPAA